MQDDSGNQIGQRLLSDCTVCVEYVVYVESC
eukprot:SAG11_NODE_21442_length_425_cov_0.628834_1_plen_30_part_10